MTVLKWRISDQKMKSIRSLYAGSSCEKNNWSTALQFTWTQKLPSSSYKASQSSKKHKFTMCRSLPCTHPTCCHLKKSKCIHFLPWTSVHSRIKWHYDLWRRKGTHSEQNSNRWWGSTHSLGIAFCSILLRFHITLTFCRLVLFIHPVRDMFKGTFYCWYHVLDSFKFLWRWINGWMFHHNMAVIISKRSDRSLL